MSRLLDMCLGAAAALTAAPVVAAAALAIRVDDGPPVLFTQERVGRGRQPFTIYKLRTMRDGQVTRVGRVLRATGIDELPQLANVLAGHMALVGPRPLARADIVRHGWDGARFDDRWSVRPGITGPAQLGLSERCDARISWVCDRAYVRHRSALLDVRILAASALCLVVGKRSTGKLLRRWRRRAGRRP